MSHFFFSVDKSIIRSINSLEEKKKTNFYGTKITQKRTQEKTCQYTR